MFTAMSASDGRIFGLDVMRATAILLVVFWHSYDLITDLAPGFEAPFFLDGVDLFFVLSGYLIGGILLAHLRKEDVPWGLRLKDFWLRRFFRTLPNYYLFLLLNILLLWLGLRPGLLHVNVLAYFVFLQNAWVSIDLFFWESWSLVVEVWFYLLFPVLLFVFSKLVGMDARKALLATTLLFLVLPMVARYLLAPEVDSIAAGERTVRKLATTRLDAVAHGVLAAWVRAFMPRVWMNLRWPLFALGLVGMCVVPSFYGDTDLHYSLTWYYTLNALSMALLLPLMASWNNGTKAGGVFTWLSRVSYALFLVHMPVRALLEPYYDAAGPVSGWMQFTLYLAICAVLAWLVQRTYEEPLMDLRERFVRR